MLSRRSLFVLALASAAFAGLAGACSDDPANPPMDAGVDAGSDAGSDSGKPDGGPGVTGLLEDEGDKPLGGLSVLACTSKFCLFGSSAADGRFSFPFDPPVDVVVKTQEDLMATPRRGAAMVPVHIADSLVDVGAVHVPNLPAGVPLGPATADPQTLKVGDGLELTVRAADLSPPIGVTLDDLAARAIPAAHVPPLAELGAEKIFAVYALHPFTTTSASPIAVRLPCNLPAGTALKFRTIGELDGHLSAPAQGHADGSFVATDPSAGIEELTWLVVSQ
jgi:hypothetical protein